MEESDGVVLVVHPGTDLAGLDGKTFQVHALSGYRLRLVPVSVAVDRRCPVVVGGERCGLQAGHEGRHRWAGGD